jgi:hypothetical protein
LGGAVADGMRKHMRPALKRAVASGNPAVVNGITDPRARSTTGRFSTYRAV